MPVHEPRKIADPGSLVTTQRYLHPDAQSIADAGTALGACLAVGFVVLGAGLLARSVLGRRRLAAWDADWRATEPWWTGRR